jgi:hypothetical protein
MKELGHCRAHPGSASTGGKHVLGESQRFAQPPGHSAGGGIDPQQDAATVL